MTQSWMIERLHSATGVMHLDADADFDLLFREDTEHADYLLFLTRQYGFEAPLEAAFVMTPNLDLMIDLDERQKAQLIAQDLLALGVRPIELVSMPQCLRVPQFRGAAEALGWMYVIERATLAHNVIRRHLSTRLPKAMREASGYLQAYSGMVGTRWREFGDVLDDVAQHPAIAERMTEAALEAFRVHRRWVQSGVRAVAVAAS
jgi:heme oxygenase (biliverdin-IX-beta and delta-forming)